jgi:hypothetical protein
MITGSRRDTGRRELIPLDALLRSDSLPRRELLVLYARRSAERSYFEHPLLLGAVLPVR